jgi:MEDS: MEthanogen/methylotroph, DcmR Sensory domain
VRRQVILENPALVDDHDHLGWWGDGRDALDQLAVAVFNASGCQNRKLLFVAEDPDPARLRGLAGLDRLLDDGDLETVSVEAVFGDGPGFDPARQLRAFEDMLGDALSQGFRGLGVVADNTPQVRGGDDEFARWLAWEYLADRFQATAPVVGVCFFDRRQLGAGRREDLAALHPASGGQPARPPYQLCYDGNALKVSGMLDSPAAGRIARLLEAAPRDRELIVDLADAEYVDHRVLIVLHAAASAARPVRIRRAPRIVRALWPLLDLPGTALRLD